MIHLLGHHTALHNIVEGATGTSRNIVEALHNIAEGVIGTSHNIVEALHNTVEGAIGTSHSSHANCMMQFVSQSLRVIGLHATALVIKAKLTCHLTSATKPHKPDGASNQFPTTMLKLSPPSLGTSQQPREKFFHSLRVTDLH